MPLWHNVQDAVGCTVGLALQWLLHNASHHSVHTTQEDPADAVTASLLRLFMGAAARAVPDMQNTKVLRTSAINEQRVTTITSHHASEEIYKCVSSKDHYTAV